ncbi:hypothetical protein NC651_022458 [Populus alba x Populus x berolinensis]|nr:hypothetical protein NC651_022458 [Populus alba x Populus x berolinensis]
MSAVITVAGNMLELAPYPYICYPYPECWRLGIEFGCEFLDIKSCYSEEGLKPSANGRCDVEMTRILSQVRLL